MVSTLRGFWLRISDGVAIHHLWEQFRADAQTSYHLYSKEFESKEIEGNRAGSAAGMSHGGSFGRW